jgi:hypothetical protein
MLIYLKALEGIWNLHFISSQHGNKQQTKSKAGGVEKDLADFLR